MIQVKARSGKYFWLAFWAGFGKMMACFVATVILLALLVDSEFLSPDSVSSGNTIAGLLFATFCSLVYGYDAGNDAVRHWRENGGD